MQVLSILKKVCKYLNKEDVFSLLDDENISSIEQNETCKDLLSILNFVICRVACEFCFCKNTEQINIEDSKGIAVSDLSKTLFSVISIKNAQGNVEYSEDGTNIYAPKGSYTLTYAYLPNDVTFSSNVNFFPSCITSDILATGVIAHYFLLKGFYTEYDIFEKMFVNKLLIVTNKKSEIRIKNRVWL